MLCGLQVVTSCSMELVNPPAGYAALFPDGSPVTTATGFGTLFSTQCAVGNSTLLAYQKAVYQQIAGMQSTAGLTPSVQYGEFLWWYFAGGSGMGYYDAETLAAAADRARPCSACVSHAERRSHGEWQRRRDLSARPAAGLCGRARRRYPLRIPYRDVRSALAV